MGSIPSTIKKKKKKSEPGALVAHACNPSYLGGSWFKASPSKYFLSSITKMTKEK
jgi:hypothetical protein